MVPEAANGIVPQRYAIPDWGITHSPPITIFSASGDSLYDSSAYLKQKHCFSGASILFKSLTVIKIYRHATHGI